MSETNETAAPAMLAGALANMTVEPHKHMNPRTGQMEATGALLVSWGVGTGARTLRVEPLSLGKQLDFLETMPPNAPEQWQTMAMAAAAVTGIDNVPSPPNYTKVGYRATLDKIGVDGLKAVLLVINGYPGTGEVPVGAVIDAEAAAKN